MPKRTVTFICGFLIPNLNEERFGENLKWIDKENGTFEIEWRHKGGPSWTEREAEVFAVSSEYFLTLKLFYEIYWFFSDLNIDILIYLH